MRGFIVAFLVLLSGSMLAQTTLTSGQWTDATVWSTGVVPVPGGTVIVNHPQEILSDLAPTGTWTFNANATDLPGGTAYVFSPAAGTNIITIASGVTVTFTGGLCDFTSGQLDIYGTLILGNTELGNSGNLNVNIKPGGTLIINGTLTNKNNSGSLVVGGTLQINGNYDGQTGSTSLTGSGSFTATGSITTSGGSTVFGQTNDCGTGPCSGATLVCGHANAISPSAVTLCTNGSTTLTANSTGTTPTYQWESSSNNSTWANAAGTSTNSTYSTGALVASTYYRVQKTVSGCTSPSASVLVTVLTGGGWIGTTNDWGTASNWCSNSVPTSATNVIISNSSAIANMPVINAGTAALCNNLTISNTFPVSTLDIAASNTASLSISGNFTNNGTFTDASTAAAAGVKFVGSTAQTIGGSTAGTYNNVTFANTSGGITLSNNNLYVASNLTMTSGVVDLGAFTLRLGTSAAATGTLAYTAGHAYNGNFQRWYPTAAVALGNASLFPVGGTSGYRVMYLVSSGVTTGGTIRVGHTEVAGATSVSFADGASTVGARSNSYWTVATNTLASGGTPFNMRTDAQVIGTVANVSHLRITLVNAAAPGSDGAHAGTTTIPQVNRTGLSVANLSNTFYWGSINAAQTTLPVELRWFKGEFENNEVELTWRTESELNSDYFRVLHSSDGEEFEEVGTVGGLGTSSTGKNYSMIHARPARGVNYYQLRQVDFDGKETSFQVIRVMADPAAEFLTLYPNPVESSGILNVEFDVPQASTTINVAIFDLSGKALIQFTAQANDRGMAGYEINMAGLAPGMYVMHAGTAKRKFVVR
jgi:hypothetical protein